MYFSAGIDKTFQSPKQSRKRKKIIWKMPLRKTCSMSVKQCNSKIILHLFSASNPLCSVLLSLLFLFRCCSHPVISYSLTLRAYSQELPWQLNGWVTISVGKISGHYDKCFYNSPVKENNLPSEQYPYYPGVAWI